MTNKSERCSERVCECCGKRCEPREVTLDESFGYEYGSEVGVHPQISSELVSECCEAEMRDPEGAECWEPETLRTETFKFLNELRESGVTNMFAATTYIVKEMEISSPDARALLVEWMFEFGR